METRNSLGILWKTYEPDGASSHQGKALTAGTVKQITSTQIKDVRGWKDCTHAPSTVGKPYTQVVWVIFRQTNNNKKSEVFIRVPL